ncbi:MAG: hypothetical protein AB7T06_21990 [Kofleriaceae bacterium]
MPVKLLAFVSLLAACTHTRPLSRAFVDVEPGRWVDVKTTSGATLSAVTVQTTTGIAYQDESGGLIDPVAIAGVVDNRTLRGAGEGFLTGAGIGAGLGVLVGLADGDDPPCDDSGHSWCLFNMTAGEKAILGGILLGGLGSIVGLAIGAVHGSDTVYTTQSGIAITPVGPSGSVAGATLTF